MNRNRTLALVALLASATSACIPDTKKLDPFRSAAAACPVLFDLVTAKIGECQGFAPYLADTYYRGSLLGCEIIAAGERAGRLGYDRALAETCINALAAPGCDQLDSACGDMPFVPKVNPGSFCLSGLECTAASDGCFHQYPTCGNGVCLAPSGTGAVCGVSYEPGCAPTHYCTGTVGAMSCQPRAGDGASCATVPCGPGLFCLAGGAVCTKQLGQGSPCTNWDQCDESKKLWCDGSAGTCQPVPTTPSGPGGRCDYPYQCAAKLWCDYASTPPSCQAKQPLNSACNRDSGCATPGAACVPDSPGSATSHCRLLLTDGSQCTQGTNSCQWGLSCLAGSGGGPTTCTRWPTRTGEACGSLSGEYTSCGSGFYCDRPAGGATGTCKPAVAPGQPCPTFAECGSSGIGFARVDCQNVPVQGNICVAPCTAP